jgi:hypothetical protein
VADAAEAASHHPDIDIRWNNKVTLRSPPTAPIGFISNDTTLAHRIQQLVAINTTRQAWPGRDIHPGRAASAAGAARPGARGTSPTHHRL